MTSNVITKYNTKSIKIRITRIVEKQPKHQRTQLGKYKTRLKLNTTDVESYLKNIEISIWNVISWASHVYGFSRLLEWFDPIEIQTVVKNAIFSTFHRIFRNRFVLFFLHKLTTIKTQWCNQGSKLINYLLQENCLNKGVIRERKT